ncbi:hypothetical protein FQA47_006930 [Oryzias melastigma]|uniref:Uncharacterized protein n=1 Tax=Oryzias melastigma TaxID=30732 RepID=A0A834CFR0_ORYME|nr:hypothetical protein FQA47_006930 [Oryzias melastigma]
MAAVFTADDEGLYSVHKKAVGVVCGSAQQNHEAHGKEQANNKDKFLWQGLVPNGPFHFIPVRVATALQCRVSKSSAMGSSVTGQKAGRCKRKTIKLKECFRSGTARTLDRTIVQGGLYGDGAHGCRDYEHKREKEPHSRPRRELHRGCS